MGLSTKVTHLSWLTATAAGGTYDVTLGFQPEIVLVFSTGNDSSPAVDTVARSTARVRFGAGASSSSRRAVVMRSSDAAAISSISVRHADAAIAIACDVNGADSGALDIDAEANWPIDGIRLIVDTQLSGVDQRLTIVGIGGSDITAATTGTFQEAGATGNATIAHGLGTTPTGALFFTVGMTSAPASGVATLGMISIGAFDGTDSCVLYGGGDDANTTMDTVSYAKSAELIALAVDPAVALTGRANGVSFDATDITISWGERAATRYCFYVVWTGGQFKVSSTTTATDTTPFSGPSAGFVSTLALFSSASRAASTNDTPTDHMQLSLGAATSASERMAQAVLDEDNVGTSEVTDAVEYDAVYANVSTASAIQGLMDVDDMTVDPMQLVMDVADPSGSFVGMAMWGSSSVDFPFSPSLGQLALLGQGVSLGFTINMPDEA
jgi:hypothetical protein